MPDRRYFVLGIAPALVALGCTNPDFGVPRICNPPPESTQVARARKFDPYPDPSIGPAVVGGRPIDYIDPRPEPDITKNTRFLSGAYPGASYPPAAAFQCAASVFRTAGDLPTRQPAAGQSRSHRRQCHDRCVAGCLWPGAGFALIEKRLEPRDHVRWRR